MTHSGTQSIMGICIKHVRDIEQLSPHNLLPTFATIATEQGAPERIVAEASRWISTEMVKKYTRSLHQSEFLKIVPNHRHHDLRIIDSR